MNVAVVWSHGKFLHANDVTEFIDHVYWYSRLDACTISWEAMHYEFDVEEE